MIDDEEYLISYANFKSNLIQKQNNFLNSEQLINFIRILILVFLFVYQIK